MCQVGNFIMSVSFDLQKYFSSFFFRLSKENDSNSVTLGRSEWLELVQAVDNIQKQAGEYLILIGWVWCRCIKHAILVKFAI